MTPEEKQTCLKAISCMPGCAMVDYGHRIDVFLIRHKISYIAENNNIVLEVDGKDCVLQKHGNASVFLKLLNSLWEPMEGQND